MKRIIASAFVVFTLSATPANATTFKCQRWMPMAMKVGFKKSDLKELDRIMYRESRCAPGAKHYNKRNGKVWSTDMGLLQVNNYSWVTYLRGLKIIKSSDDLLHPETNLRAAKALYDYSVKRGYNRWHQWRTFGGGSYAK
jgi:hypothetical protein